MHFALLSHGRKFCVFIYCTGISGTWISRLLFGVTFFAFSFLVGDGTAGWSEVSRESRKVMLGKVGGELAVVDSWT
jgi:hypothetical protein